MRPSADGISPITFFPYEQIKKGNHVTFGHTGINQIHLIYGIPSKDLKNMEMTYWKMDEIQKKICANCEIENPEAKLCGRCKRVYYCGQECQTIHWKNIHKQLCQPPEKKNLNFTPLNEKQKKIFF